MENLLRINSQRLWLNYFFFLIMSCEKCKWRWNTILKIFLTPSWRQFNMEMKNLYEHKIIPALFYLIWDELLKNIYFFRNIKKMQYLTTSLVLILFIYVLVVYKSLVCQLFQLETNRKHKINIENQTEFCKTKTKNVYYRRINCYGDLGTPVFFFSTRS